MANKEVKIVITGDASGLVGAAGQGSGAMDRMKHATGGAKEEGAKVSQTIANSLDPSLTKVAKSGHEAAESAEKMEIRHRELHRAASVLGPVLGEVAVAMRDLAESNPVMATILLVTAAIEGLKQVTEAMIPELLRFGESLAPSLAAATERTQEAENAMQKYRIEMNETLTVEQRLAHAWSERESQIHDEAEAHGALAEAVKRTTEAKLKLALAEGRITQDQYTIQHAELEAGTEREKLQIRQQERARMLEAHKESAQEAKSESGIANTVYGAAEGDARSASELASENKERLDKARKQVAHYLEELGKVNMHSQEGRDAEREYRIELDKARETVLELTERQGEIESDRVSKEAAASRARDTALGLKKKADELEAAAALEAAHNKRMIASEREAYTEGGRTKQTEMADEFLKTPEGQQILQAMQTVDAWRQRGGGDMRIQPGDKAQLSALYRKLFGLGPSAPVSNGALMGAFGGASDASKALGLFGREKAFEEIGTAEGVARTVSNRGDVSPAAQNLLIHAAQVGTGHEQTLQQAAAYMIAVAQNQKRFKELLDKLQSEVTNLHNF